MALACGGTDTGQKSAVGGMDSKGGASNTLSQGGTSSRDTSPAGGGSAATTGGIAATGTDTSGADFASVSLALSAAIDQADTSVDFTLMLANAHGTFFTHSKGSFTPDTPVESASTSKWVTSAVLLHLIDNSGGSSNALQLASRPQDYLTGWASDDSDLRSHITLQTLLSFRSGLQPSDGTDLPCTSLGSLNMATCVALIYTDAASSTRVPGEGFVYGSHHMQVAGLMAMNQQGVDTWGKIFDGFKSDTGLFPTSDYELPSTTNPRLAGGMVWTAREYLAFLGKLFDGSLLSQQSALAMFADNTPADSVSMGYSPVVDGVSEEWHYGLGNWLECPYASWQVSCASARRYSSPGAYGAYPFIDIGKGFYGILARQGPLGTFRDGLAVYRSLEPLVNQLVQVAP